MLFGFKVIGTANNGMDAVIKFKAFTEEPDFVFMDHRMPIKNGIEATKEILRSSNHSKIIFASADNLVKEIALSIGAFIFIEKLLKIHELVEKIEYILGF